MPNDGALAIDEGENAGRRWSAGLPPRSPTSSPRRVLASLELNDIDIASAEKETAKSPPQKLRLASMVWGEPERGNLLSTTWAPSIFVVVEDGLTVDRVFDSPLLGTVRLAPPAAGIVLPANLYIRKQDAMLSGPLNKFFAGRSPAFVFDVERGPEYRNWTVLLGWSLRTQFFVVELGDLDLCLLPMNSQKQLWGYVTARGEFRRWAVGLMRDDIRSLLEARKLPLVLDLDQTLIDTVAADAAGAADRPPAHYSIPSMNYDVRVRPFVPQFLREAATLFRLSICTAGAKGYAHAAIAGLQEHMAGLYPDVDWGSVLPTETILSVHELHRCGLAQAKDLRAIFSFSADLDGPRLPLVVDDNARWWNTAQRANIVVIPPFTGHSMGTALPEILELLRGIHGRWFERWEAGKARVGAGTVYDPPSLPDVRDVFAEVAAAMVAEAADGRPDSDSDSDDEGGRAAGDVVAFVARRHREIRSARSPSPPAP
eukprot:tig00001003_g6268.t1